MSIAAEYTGMLHLQQQVGMQVPLVETLLSKEHGIVCSKPYHGMNVSVRISVTLNCSVKVNVCDGYYALNCEQLQYRTYKNRKTPKLKKHISCSDSCEY
jgi:hypothetical protein